MVTIPSWLCINVIFVTDLPSSGCLEQVSFGFRWISSLELWLAASRSNFFVIYKLSRASAMTRETRVASIFSTLSPSHLITPIVTSSYQHCALILTAIFIINRSFVAKINIVWQCLKRGWLHAAKEEHDREGQKGPENWAGLVLGTSS